MSETKFSQPKPAVRCWITHLVNGKYSENNKIIYTLFGKYQRARLVGTLMKKEEIIDNSYNPESDEIDTSRIIFDLDDGTGRIQAILWQVDPEDYEHLNEGDLIDIVGKINQYRNQIQIVPRIIKKVIDPNFILLRDAEIIREIQKGNTHEIPEPDEDEIGLDEIPSDIDVDALFEDDSSLEEEPLKQKIYLFIEESTSKGNGISFENLKKKIKASEQELRSIIRDLEMEAKIFQSEKDIFEAYPKL
jgi:hypothetical protein